MPETGGSHIWRQESVRNRALATQAQPGSQTQEENTVQEQDEEKTLEESESHEAQTENMSARQVQFKLARRRNNHANQ